MKNYPLKKSWSHTAIALPFLITVSMLICGCPPECPGGANCSPTPPVDSCKIWYPDQPYELQGNYDLQPERALGDDDMAFSIANWCNIDSIHDTICACKWQISSIEILGLESLSPECKTVELTWQVPIKGDPTATPFSATYHLSLPLVIPDDAWDLTLQEGSILSLDFNCEVGDMDLELLLDGLCIVENIDGTDPDFPARKSASTKPILGFGQPTPKTEL